jgi:galactose mutarotase-like enzyme
MYGKLIWRQLTEWSNRLWQAAVMRSGMLTITVLAVVLLTLAIGWHEHMRGQFARLKRELKRPAAVLAPAPPLPGGQEPVVLERSTTIEGGSVPEFLSATLLPGRGMNVFQIKAHLPGKGEVELLASPPIGEATARMTGKGEDANGSESLAVGAALEIPWAGGVFGSPAGSNGLNTAWQGRNIHLTADRLNGATIAKGGLLLRAAFSSVKMNVMPDGGEAEGVYAGNFDGRWPSKLEITSTTQLSSRVLEMKVTARNTGDEPEPIGIGWQPRFAVLNRDRGSMILRLPSVTRIQMSAQHPGEPTGKLLSVAGTKYDFSGRTGARLDGLVLEDTFVNLRQAPLDNGPVAELRDPANGYGLRITMLSPSIRALHVSAPGEGGYVTISPRFNYDDPFGREWNNEDTGMAVLRPGQTAQWRIRLEIFALSSNEL